MKEVKIKIAEKQYKVKLAETEETHKNGLQNIEHLPEDEGMLFVFDEEEIRSFWMKDTVIPLDIIFINENLIVTEVYKGEPNSTEMLYGPCSYVLELNQGSGIKEGDELEFEPKEKSNKMLVLDSGGEVQMELEGGERIMSRSDTKTLIKFAKKAATTNSDSDYRALGKRVFKFLEKQENTPAEYVEGKEKNENENEN